MTRGRKRPIAGLFSCASLSSYNEELLTERLTSDDATLTLD